MEALVGFVTAEDVDLLVAVKQRIEDRGIALPPIDDRERVVVRWTLAHDDRARKRHDELAHLPIRAFKRRLLDHVPGVVFRARGHCRKRQVGIRIDRRRSLAAIRSEEHTSELQSLMRKSYAVFCLKKQN